MLFPKLGTPLLTIVVFFKLEDEDLLDVVDDFFFPIVVGYGYLLFLVLCLRHAVSAENHCGDDNKRLFSHSYIMLYVHVQVICSALCQNVTEHCSPMDDDFSGFADERLFIIVGCMCRLRSFDMSNSDSDAST